MRLQYVRTDLVNISSHDTLVRNDTLVRTLAQQYSCLQRYSRAQRYSIAVAKCGSKYHALICTMHTVQSILSVFSDSFLLKQMYPAYRGRQLGQENFDRVERNDTLVRNNTPCATIRSCATILSCVNQINSKHPKNYAMLFSTRSQRVRGSKLRRQLADSLASRTYCSFHFPVYVYVYVYICCSIVYIGHGPGTSERRILCALFVAIHPAGSTLLL